MLAIACPIATRGDRGATTKKRVASPAGIAAPHYTRAAKWAQADYGLTAPGDYIRW